MRKCEAELPVGQRADAIAARFKRGRKPLPPPPPLADMRALGMAKARKRRERLKAERDEWASAIERYDGNAKRIARHMGYDVETVNRSIWDLGLWPALVRARRRAL